MKKITPLFIVFALLFSLTACTINNEKTEEENQVKEVISSAEITYQILATYSNLCSLVKNYEQTYGYNPLGFDPSVSPDEQKYSTEEESGETSSEYNTWMDYITDTAICAIQERKALAAKTKAEGIMLDEDDVKKIDDLIEDFKVNYDLDEKTASVESLLKLSYGDDMTVEIFRKIQEEAILSEKYEENKTQEFYDSYKSDELKAIYDKNKSEYGTLGVAICPLEYTHDKKEETKKQADAMLEKMTDVETVEKIMSEIDISSAKLYNAATRTDLNYYDSTEKIKSWAFNKERKVGDKKVFEGSGVYYVLYITKTVYDTYPYSSRHILLTFEDDETVTDATWKNLLADAEKIVDEWKKGKADEQSFAQLAEKYSEDTGSNTNGGLYENIRPDYFVKEYEDWCLDPERKYGDVGIVKVESAKYKGYHIIYFVSQNEMTVWEDQIRSEKSSEDYQNHSTKIFSNECSKYTFDNETLQNCISKTLESMKSMIENAAEE